MVNRSLNLILYKALTTFSYYFATDFGINYSVFAWVAIMNFPATLLNVAVVPWYTALRVDAVLLVFELCLCAACLLVLGWHNLYGLVFLRFATGFAITAVRSEVNAMVGAYTPKGRRRTRAISLLELSFGLSAAGFLGVGAALQYLGWRFFFLISAVSIFALAVAIFLSVPSWRIEDALQQHRQQGGGRGDADDDEKNRKRVQREKRERERQVMLSARTLAVERRASPIAVRPYVMVPVDHGGEDWRRARDVDDLLALDEEAGSSASSGSSRSAHEDEENSPPRLRSASIEEEEEDEGRGEGEEEVVVHRGDDELAGVQDDEAIVLKAMAEGLELQHKQRLRQLAGRGQLRHVKRELSYQKQGLSRSQMFAQIVGNRLLLLVFAAQMVNKVTRNAFYYTFSIWLSSSYGLSATMAGAVSLIMACGHLIGTSSNSLLVPLLGVFGTCLLGAMLQTLAQALLLMSWLLDFVIPLWLACVIVFTYFYSCQVWYNNILQVSMMPCVNARPVLQPTIQTIFLAAGAAGGMCGTLASTHLWDWRREHGIGLLGTCCGLVLSFLVFVIWMLVKRVQEREASDAAVLKMRNSGSKAQKHSSKVVRISDKSGIPLVMFDAGNAAITNSTSSLAYTPQSLKAQK